jgi:hypothetical protein
MKLAIWAFGLPGARELIVNRKRHRRRRGAGERRGLSPLILQLVFPLGGQILVGRLRPEAGRHTAFERRVVLLVIGVRTPLFFFASLSAFASDLV